VRWPNNFRHRHQVISAIGIDGILANFRSYGEWAIANLYSNTLCRSGFVSPASIIDALPRQRERTSFVASKGFLRIFSRFEKLDVMFDGSIPSLTFWMSLVDNS
jgi:hypothetical protein